MTAIALTTREAVDAEIIQGWRLLMMAEEAGRRLSIDGNGDHNEGWVDAADDLLAARHVISVRARIVPTWSPEMDEWPTRSCVDLTREVARRYRAIPLELEPWLWSLAVVHVADAVRAVERATSR